jgi:hypothetical protein
VDWFLRRYGVAFLSADSIYLSDAISIENTHDKREIIENLSVEDLAGKANRNPCQIGGEKVRG